MRIPPPFCQGIRVAAAAGLMLCLVSACKPAAKPAAPAKPAAAKPSLAASSPSNAVEVSLSVFEQLVPPKGRDPFFPNSRRREPEPVKGVSIEKAPASSALELKGVVGSANHRLALINDKTILGVGEEESVTVPGGHVKVRCLEIGEDYAVVQVAGEVHTKRLEVSKKGL